MEILVPNIVMLIPPSVFALETWGLFYFIHNVVLYIRAIRKQAIPQLVNRFMGKCKANASLSKKYLFLFLRDTPLV